MSAAPRPVWQPLLAMGSLIVALHVLGWGTLLGWVVPQQLPYGDQGVFGLGLGVTAYVLGMRHAFDVDHIVAIDNTTRKQIADGQRPLSVGFWFSLGHSSVVFVLVALLGFGVNTVADQLVLDASWQRTAGLVGGLVSGTFLLLIGVLNLVVLRSLLGQVGPARAGTVDADELEAQLQGRGLIARVTSRVSAVVRRPWHMYPVGLLFGLGFDTATEIGLLVLAGGAAAAALPWYAVLTLPVLFAAGMTLLDTADGVLMWRAYGWAQERPMRTLYYNLTVTGLSVAVALLVGGIELVSVAGEAAGLTETWLASLDLSSLGYLVLALFVAVWIAALVLRRIGRRYPSTSPPPHPIVDPS